MFGMNKSDWIFGVKLTLFMFFLFVAIELVERL